MGRYSSYAGGVFKGKSILLMQFQYIQSPDGGGTEFESDRELH